jgi:hypothetical protein
LSVGRADVPRMASVPLRACGASSSRKIGFEK